jgi:hypothetical protein
VRRRSRRRSSSRRLFLTCSIRCNSALEICRTGVRRYSTYPSDPCACPCCCPNWDAARGSGDIHAGQSAKRHQLTLHSAPDYRSSSRRLLEATITTTTETTAVRTTTATMAMSERLSVGVDTQGRRLRESTSLGNRGTARTASRAPCGPHGCTLVSRIGGASRSALRG